MRKSRKEEDITNTKSVIVHGKGTEGKHLLITVLIIIGIIILFMLGLMSLLFIIFGLFFIVFGFTMHYHNKKNNEPAYFVPSILLIMGIGAIYHGILYIFE